MASTAGYVTWWLLLAPGMETNNGIPAQVGRGPTSINHCAARVGRGPTMINHRAAQVGSRMPALHARLRALWQRDGDDRCCDERRRPLRAASSPPFSSPLVDGRSPLVDGRSPLVD
eukprot:7468547-Pyramimonas_sp.AAC.1